MINCLIAQIIVNMNPVFCLKKSEREIEEEQFDTLAKDIQL